MRLLLKMELLKRKANGSVKEKCKYPNFKALPFWIQRLYYDQIWITSTSCHRNQNIWPNFLVWSPPWLYASSVKRIKYWKAAGWGKLPSLIPALWNIGILLHKQATRAKHFVGKCSLLGLEQLSQGINLDLRASLAPQGITL